MGNPRAKIPEDVMAQGVVAVKNSMPLNTAATRYGIARNTLRYHVNDGAEKKYIGRPALLSFAQGRELCSRIFRVADVGMPLSSKLVKRTVFTFCVINGIKNNFCKNLGLVASRQDSFRNLRTIVGSGSFAVLEQSRRKNRYESKIWENFSDVWLKSMTPNNIMSRFRATGICPFNPEVTPHSAFAPSDLYCGAMLKDLALVRQKGGRARRQARGEKGARRGERKRGLRQALGRWAVRGEGGKEAARNRNLQKRKPRDIR
ncbi:hypothetical protein ANN_04934 [Periplaneta americana]|uniref:HTH psq-type domain-containing protein n=1 Tax=Periplaneta americana TaxID=6978 RepID=A0ABQ8TBC5_PERAM|nr:hypothetical protein ANN_04934 [Periplaneta americana]